MVLKIEFHLSSKDAAYFESYDYELSVEPLETRPLPKMPLKIIDRLRYLEVCVAGMQDEYFGDDPYDEGFEIVVSDRQMEHSSSIETQPGKWYGEETIVYVSPTHGIELDRSAQLILAHIWPTQPKLWVKFIPY